MPAGNGEVESGGPLQPLMSWDQVSSDALTMWTVSSKPPVNAVALATNCHLKRIPADGFEHVYYPMGESIHLLPCPHCHRRFLAQSFVAHSSGCTGRSPSPEPPMRDRGDGVITPFSLANGGSGCAGASAYGAGPGPVSHCDQTDSFSGMNGFDDPDFKKGKKKSNGFTSSKQKHVLDLDRMCGVEGPQVGPCMRVLTCKAHSIKLKREVYGRSRYFDDLMMAVSGSTEMVPVNTAYDPQLQKPLNVRIKLGANAGTAIGRKRKAVYPDSDGSGLGYDHPSGAKSKRQMAIEQPNHPTMI